ncbi:gluconokinase [Thecamonas trahens ATCC 50062]|uniref:Gluconokinase n=1 Tax=Thecamonas trahens ATCC 50062 TaxID=461836 RepID=A0A0L0D888_THETB|nr:gluconokinase [Thecamonas trahens ATCC 50062]KNC48562.1 gluconokinase [Thecamonas trahens ATCC 50062]|eukprot:XP_013762618.1 gluconokinase [Thecamonas trahens ATCC 50062]
MAVVVMGVSGCGKSSVGSELVAALAARSRAARFVEGDEVHPQANVEKMAAGIPLDDDDRMPWLEALADMMREVTECGLWAVTSCSALKRAYRDTLRRRCGRGLVFVHLDVAEDVVAGRVAGREGHFMPAALVASQFESLEALATDEVGDRRGLVVDAGGGASCAETAESVADWLCRTVKY